METFIRTGTHKNIGKIAVTPSCIALLALGTDPTSTYVYHIEDDEIKEVSKNLITWDEDQKPMSQEQEDATLAGLLAQRELLKQQSGRKLPHAKAQAGIKV